MKQQKFMVAMRKDGFFKIFKRTNNIMEANVEKHDLQQEFEKYGYSIEIWEQTELNPIPHEI